MRHILSTAVTAVIVSLLTLSVAGALAQSTPSADSTKTVGPASGLNADTVDHKHAVGFTNKAAARRNRLVATNRYGLLPSNIVKPLWSSIKGMPTGFADGVDDGIVHMTTTQVVGSGVTLDPNTYGYDTVSCPAGSHVISGGFSTDSSEVFATESYQDGNGWLSDARNTTISPHTFYALAICLTTDPMGALRTRNPLKARDLLPRDK
jgi:hypothetical protein